jgi:hypothetical protein
MKMSKSKKNHEQRDDIVDADGACLICGTRAGVSPLVYRDGASVKMVYVCERCAKE